MASIKAQIDILLTGQRNISNLLGQLNEIEGAIAQIASKWKVASAALQRADIRLGVTGRQQPRGEGGRFASDPDRQARLAALADRRRAAVEQRLARMGLSTASRQEASIRDQIEGNERILRQTERRITFQERLNSAVQLFETRQQKLARGGGGRGLSQGLQERAREIQAAFEAAGGGASRNLSLINSLATGLGRVVERQNEFNRAQSLGKKGFEAGRRLQERLDVVAERGVVPSQRIDRLRRGAARVIATSESGDQQAYSGAVRAATAAISRVERESKKLADDLTKNATRSPIRGGTGFPNSPKALVEAARANEKLSSAAVTLDKQRQSALEKIFQVEEKIRSSKKISFKEAQDYYFQAQLPRTALPFGDVNQPAMRGGARRGGVSREILGGGRSAGEAEAAFRLVEEKSKKTAKVVKESFADAYKAALPPDALSGLTALEKVGKTLFSMKGGGGTGQEKQRKELDALQQALSAMEGRKYDPLGISDKQINAGLNERASQLQRILQVEEKIRSSRRISAKEAQEYYSRTQLPRLALPFGDVNQPAIRGGARQGGSAREFLGGSRSAEDAEKTFRLIEEKASKTGKAIKESFADAYKAMLPPDTVLTGLAALGKVGKTLASMKVGSGGRSGLQEAIENLQEARGARGSFFGGASPAEAIDQIVREFNTGKPAATEAAGNITQSFSSGLKKGAASSAAAAKSFATAAAQAIKDVFGIKSPSRFMIELVQNLVSTYIAEMQKSYPRIEAATQKAFGQETLLRDVKKLTATNKGFEFAGRASTGFRPLAMGAGTEGTSGEFQQMMGRFRKDIAGLTTQPEIYQNLLNALPDSRITTDLAGAANRRALASEQLPSFMSTQRMLGPGELEKTIAKAAADYFRTVRAPDPWVGLVGDYKKNFVDRIIALTQQIKAQPALPPARGVRIAGALPPALFESGLSPAQELRRQRAYQRSDERSAAVMGQGTARGLSLPSATPGGPQLALPPAAQRGLQDAISDLFGRISNAVRGAFGGAGGPRPPVGGLPGGTGGGGQGGQAQQAVDLLGLDALGDISRISTRELETLSATFSELRAILDPTIQGFDRLDNQLRETIGNIDRQVERRAPDADLLTRSLGPRTGRAVSEGLIGGAFPLLFGQGIGASAGGLIGGAAGGFAGGGLGFGLSLVGTALGSAFDTAVQSATELGAALNDVSTIFDKVKEKSLFSSRETEKYATKLQEAGFVASASALAQQEIIKKIGTSGVEDLAALESESDKLSRQLGELALQMQTLVAGPLAAFIEKINEVLGVKLAGDRAQNVINQLFDEGKTKEARRLASRVNEITNKNAGNASKIVPEINLATDEARKLLIPINIEPKLTQKQIDEQVVSVLEKRLQTINIAKGLKDQAIASAREQQNIDNQRAELVRSYEESLASLREGVEERVSALRLQTLEKENQLLDVQSSIRLKSLEIANQQMIAEAGAGKRPEITAAAKEVAQIVADYTQNQLTAEEEGARIKRDAALDVLKTDLEAAKFKINTEKEISRLNTETARRVAEINKGVREKNQDIDQNKFKLEQQVAVLQLKTIQAEFALLNQQAASAGRLGAQIQADTSKAYNALAEIIKATQGLKAPGRIREAAGAGGGGVSFAGVDRASSDFLTATKNYVAAQLALNDLDPVKNTQEFTQRIASFADKTDEVFTKLTLADSDEQAEQLRYSELISKGVTDTIAQKVIELETTKAIALAMYDIGIAQLQGKIIAVEKNAADKARNELLAQEIKLLQQRKAALEGTAGDFNQGGATATGAIGQAVNSENGKRLKAFVDQGKAELNDLEAVAARVSQSIGDAVGGSLANGIRGLVEGTGTAKEVFAEFLKEMSEILLKEATRMIAVYVAIGIAKAFAGLSGGGGKAPTPGAAPQMTPGAIVTPTGFTGQFAGVAANGATFANGIAQFAKGGAFSNSIVSSPTLFQFADGGVTKMGEMGEAGPEAIMPLKRGPDGRLGVDASGMAVPYQRPAAAATTPEMEVPYRGNGPALAVPYLRSGGGTAGDSMNATIDVKFETVRIGGVDYVTRDEAEQIGRESAQRGADLAHKRYRNSPSARRAAGFN